MNNQYNSIPILEVAERLGLRVNRYKKTTCFIHDSDRDPSLSFNVKGNYWNCFGCNEGGNVINLVMKYYKIEYDEAIKWLNNNFFNSNIEIHQKYFKLSSRRKIIRKSITQIEPYEPDIEVYEWVIDNLKIGSIGLEYLKGRGIEEQLIKVHQIKDITKPGEFYKNLIKKWGEQRILESGLISKTTEGEIKYLYKQHIILYPYFNEDNKIIYLQARNIGECLLKYINLINIPLQIYNLNIIKSLKYGDEIYLCEGIMDTLSAEIMGMNAFGIIGAMGFKVEWAERFVEYKIFIIPDNDQGGDKFYKRVSTIFSNIHIHVKRVNIDKKYNDLSEYLENEHIRKNIR